MLIDSKKGKFTDTATNGKKVDWLELEWHETRKRILRKHTTSGQELTLKFLNESPDFAQGDILYEDAGSMIVVEIIPCDCLIAIAATPFETASICYEIGNKHLPLFYDNGELLVPYEAPLHRLLQAQGYQVKREFRKLHTPLKTTVSPHGNTSHSLFSRIMQITNAEK